MMPHEDLQKVERLIAGAKDTQIVFVAASLGIPDLLASASRSSDDLATQLGVDRLALRRVLRGLVNRGLLLEREPCVFTLTDAGRLLCSGQPRGLQGLAIRAGSVNFAAWGNLLDGVRTGSTPFEIAHGVRYFDYLAATPDVHMAFNDRMASASERTAPAIVDVFDFAPYTTVVDVGGGYGSLLREMLGRHPQSRGVLLETPESARRARGYVEEHGIGDRVRVVAGDFFEEIPPGDLHVLEAVLHDWPDDAARRIVANCREAMHNGGRLLVIEDLLPDAVTAPSETVEIDLVMLVNHGGRERTRDEYTALLESEGLRVVGVHSTATHLFVIEAEAIR